MVLREVEELAHLALTKLLRALSKHEEEGIDHVRFAAAIRSNDCREALRGAHAKYTIHAQVYVQELVLMRYLVKWSYNAFARIRFEVLQDQLPNHQPPLRREGCSGLFHCLLSLA